MSFLPHADAIIQGLVAGLARRIPEASLLIGGGAGYRSRKYDDPAAAGDLDLFCCIERPEDLDAVIDPDVLAELGFVLLHMDSLVGDRARMVAGMQSVIRISGTIEGVKTSLNVALSAHLLARYSDLKTLPLSKCAHTKTYVVFYAYTSTGERILTANFSPEYTVSATEHYRLVPDFTWYATDGWMTFGIFTDFLAKGSIVRDPAGSLRAIQARLLSVYASSASQELRTGRMTRMFASSELFAEDMERSLERDLHSRIQGASKCSVGAMPSFLAVYAPLDTFQEASAPMSPWQTPAEDGSVVSGSMREILRRINDTADGFTDHMLLLNAEAKRLGRLIHLAVQHRVAAIPEHMLMDSLFLQKSDELTLATVTLRECDIAQRILEDAAADTAALPAALHPLAQTTFARITDMRTEAAVFIAQTTGRTLAVPPALASVVRQRDARSRIVHDRR